MTTLSDIERWIQETYNDHISVYDYGTYIRVTNGSAGMYADIRARDGYIKVEGERYGRSFNQTTDPNELALLDALSENLGL